MVDLSDDRAAAEAWSEARRKVVLERALEVLRTDTRLGVQTLKAFDLCAMRGVPAETAAAECGISVAEVYVAKNRAIKKLREIVSQFTQEYDGE